MTARTIVARLKCPRIARRVKMAELIAGTQAEMEHTRSFNAARCIALAHLAEIPDYYTRLARMEKAGLRAKRS